MIEMIRQINLCYVVFIFLGFMVGICYLKEKCFSKSVSYLFILLYLIFTVISFSYLNGVFSSIFELKYLSVKIYLLVILIMNMIVLFTIHKKMKLIYKVFNYIAFIILTIIFGSILSIIIGSKIDMFYVMDISNAVILIDLSFVIFILYTILMEITYMGDCLFKANSNCKRRFKKEIRLNLLKRKKKDYQKVEHKEILSPQQLLQYDRKDGFYIDGVECSIIFDDSNQENIVRNYYILLEDIHAKLVNGYTLEENQMLKNICMKLQVGNLRNIDMNNVSILNRISVEEYNLLKRVFKLN